MAEKIYEKILDELEEIETVFLSWGIVETKLSYFELSRIIQNILTQTPDIPVTPSVDGIINDLLAMGLIYRFEDVLGADENDLFFRTRMAETARLAFLLRQQFPRHEREGGWQNAPRLVSDYRFAREHRRFPKKSVTPQNLNDRLGELRLSSAHRASLGGLIDSYSNSGYLFREFQAEATIEISKTFEISDEQEDQKKFDRGFIVTSGTGSGKTLAFYLPVLARIASKILIAQQQDKNWLQCLAIYPRVELQRDQFQSLIQESRRLNDLLLKQGKRKLRLGILYGDTPGYFGSPGTVASIEKKWKATGNGFVCPYFKCWVPECDGHFIWPFESLKRGEEKLQCSNCDNEIGSDEIALTRSSIQRTPPDVLFTSSEMLNRCLADNSYRDALGFISKAPYNPEFLLVDEAHIYSGTFGAQFAYLIRRWRHQLREPITVVGLSATLVDAEKYFEELVGLPNGFVQLITPSFSSLVSEGVGYLIALKGDPISKTALLSTTIQTNMLFSRMLDRETDRRSGGIYGTKAFTFADDIDVANRLFWNTRDAEGLTNTFGPLARLREPGLSMSRKTEGQDWEFPEQISGSLSNSKIIERVSSQDKGLDPGSEIVIATSSLEVGFDDPNVGAIIQHKSPRNFAGFLQRKGRAGRQSSMRPWTAIVLSDYGRDRMSFQSYEQLFDPEIEPASLPLDSLHVKRIQATYFLLDYLARELFFDRSVSTAWWKQNVWSLVRFKPTRESEERELQLVLIGYLRELVSSEQKRNNFSYQMRRALRVSERDALAILWGHPRPLMTSVIPSILRRLQIDFKNSAEVVLGDETLLPDYLPSALFSDLNLPELTIELPDRSIQKMPILQGLKAFTPGKVSKRFGIAHENQRHWMQLQGLGSPEVCIDIAQDGFVANYVGDWGSAGEGRVRVYRPLVVPIRIPEHGIKDTSNSVAVWQTEFVFHLDANVMPISGKVGASSKLFKRVSVLTHQAGCPLMVRRYFSSSEATIKRRNAEDLFVSIPILKDGNPVALGFETEVDALSFELDLSITTNEESISKYQNHLGKLRTKRFFSEVVNSHLLEHIPNPFLRGWVSSVFFDSVCLEAATSDCSICDAIETVLDDAIDFDFVNVLEKLFQSNEVTTANSEDIEHGFDTTNTEESDQLRNDIIQALQSHQTKQALRTASSMLTSEIDQGFLSWIEVTAANTLAKIIAEAAKRLMPNFDESEIVVDVIKQEGDVGIFRLVLSEMSPGGIGLIEDLADEFALDPRMFFSVVSSVTAANEQELVDAQLREIISSCQEHDSVFARRFDDFRNATSAEQKDAQRSEVINTLVQNDHVLFHSFQTTLFSRVLRPGTGSSSDELYAKIFEFWDQLNGSLGVEIDSRVISFAYASNFPYKIDSVLNSMGFQKPETNEELWRTNLANSLIWPSGVSIRNLHLDAYNPFNNSGAVERIIVECLLDDEDIKVSLMADTWHSDFSSRIAQQGIVKVTCLKTNQAELARFLNQITVEPVFAGYLKVYPRVTQIKQVDKAWELTVELPEVIQ